MTSNPPAATAPRDRQSALSQNLPWPFTAAALVAFAALYITANHFIELPLVAILLIASQLTPLRLPRAPILTWIVRIAFWAFFLAISPQRRPNALPVMYDPYYVNLFGYFCAAELALRAWTRAPTGPSRGDAILLTTLVFAAASNTYDAHIRYLAPLYAVFTVLCLRVFNKTGPARPQTPSRPQPPRRRLPSLLALRATALAAAMLLAASSVYAVTRYEYLITQWAVDMLGQRGSRGEIGFSTAARLQAVFNPERSLSRVLLIDGPVAQRHLRVLAYDTYHDSTWFPQFSDRGFRAASPMPPPPARSTTLTFTPLGGTGDLLALPLSSARIEGVPSLEQDALDDLRGSADDAALAYSVTLGPTDQSQGPLCTPPGESERPRLLALPPDLDPRVPALAKKIAPSNNPATRLRQIVAHLQANHKYSLSFQPQGEPLSDFILHNRAAHCQYFAAAAVMLARATGIPARFVTGFYAHERDGDDRMVVRECDAHAWAEAWLDGAGWVTVDATPASGRPDALYPKPSLARRAWERLHDLPAALRDLLARYTAAVLTLAALPAAVVALAWLLKQLLHRRPKADPDAYPTPSQELQQAAARFARLLAQQKISIPANKTWPEHLAPLPHFHPFLQAYTTARFGHPTPEQLAALNTILNDLEQANKNDLQISQIQTD